MKFNAFDCATKQDASQLTELIYQLLTIWCSPCTSLGAGADTKAGTRLYFILFIFLFAAWIQCFAIYAAIIIAHSPERAQGLQGLHAQHCKGKH